MEPLLKTTSQGAAAPAGETPGESPGGFLDEWAVAATRWCVALLGLGRCDKTLIVCSDLFPSKPVFIV